MSPAHSGNATAVQVASPAGDALLVTGAAIVSLALIGMLTGGR